MLQFDQWRIAHLAEFGINTFDNAPSTPAPSRQQADKAKSRHPKTPKTKRKEKDEQEGSNRKAKSRRDSEPTQDSDEPKRDQKNDIDKENKEPSKFGSLFDSLSCDQCGTGFATLMEYIGHKKICVPLADKPFAEKEDIQRKTSTEAPAPKVQPSSTQAENNATHQKCDNTQIKQKETNDGEKDEENLQPFSFNMTNFRKCKTTSSGLCCEKCDEKFTSMVKYEKHRSQCDKTK